jgi:tetratricopeptide (TPR) repeat protein
MRLRLIAVLGVTGALLAGCAQEVRRQPPAPILTPGQQGTQRPPAQPATPPPPGMEIRPYVPPSAPQAPGQGQARPVPSRAVQVLERRADDQLRAGDLAGAAASLERALRIAPRDADLWSRLAQVRERQGQFGQAADLASKSNSLIGNSRPGLSYENWSLIARVRRAVGDLAGARAAEGHARTQALRLKTH